METLNLPGLKQIEWYTPGEKKPNDGQYIVFITIYMNSAFTGMINGRYKTFKKAPGRFVSETHGSHVESNILYWTDAHPIKN